MGVVLGENVMLVLGLETSCDETAAAVVADGRWVRSSVVASQIELHTPYGGVVPELASRAHSERIVPVVERAVREGGVELQDVDAIAVGHRPGLIGSLLVGVAAGKALAWVLGKPLVAVDHVHAHLFAGGLRKEGIEASRHPGIKGQGRDGQDGEEVEFPALGLVVSGGHTSIYAMRDWVTLERIGATIDDALGEAFDKAATILGLPYPGGPNVDRLASEAGADESAVRFPVSRLAKDSLDVSFSGLKTALLYEVRPPAATRGKFARSEVEAGEPARGQGAGTGRAPIHRGSTLTHERARDLAASFQKAAVEAIVLKLERAMERGKVKSLIVGGGVSANSRLRRELAGLARGRGVRLWIPTLDLCVDNAAMIAGLGCELLARGVVSDLSLQPVPTTAC